MSRLRQVVAFVDDLDATEKKAAKLLESFVTFRDESLQSRFGVRNAVLPVGNGFVEFFSLETPSSSPSHSVNPSPSLSHNESPKDFHQRSQTSNHKILPGGFMLRVQVSGEHVMRHALERVSALGLRTLHRESRGINNATSIPTVEAFETQSGPGFDSEGLHSFVLHAQHTGCMAEFVLQNPRNKWNRAGTEWLKHDERTKIAHSSSLGIAGVVVGVRDSEEARRVAAVWTDVLRLDPAERVEDVEDGVRITLDDDSTIDVRPAIERGLYECRLYTASPKIRDGEVHTIGGLRFVFVHPFGDAHL